MVDQSHNLKGKVEAMIQTVYRGAGTLFEDGALVDYPRLVVAQEKCDFVRAESTLQDAFAIDVRPMIQQWRRSKGFPSTPWKRFAKVVIWNGSPKKDRPETPTL